ncbi:uncharacterized protein [Nicotiana tomentosiformis]|uniref:uncharacterized protein isoform X11 n=2 Tax=Nicotiana tomentosiformis TaxID=4098 RepID=UPI0008785D20|nr:uncharacterized protein LOC104100489 isoform X4 [Nicotiana tomentosiformis]
MRKQRVTAHESSIRVKMWDFALWSLSSYGALLLFLHHKQKLEYSTQEQNEAAYGWKISKGVASHQHLLLGVHVNGAVMILLVPSFLGQSIYTETTSPVGLATQYGLC